MTVNFITIADFASILDAVADHGSVVKCTSCNDNGYLDYRLHQKGESFDYTGYRPTTPLKSFLFPPKEKVETDRQLALYSIAVKEMYGENLDVLLVWHYLAHNLKVTSKRTNEQLQKLKEDTMALINQIESTTEFPHCESILCKWCEFKSMCPAHGGKPPELQSQLGFE